ncbi:MAG: hypothetical protein E7582_00215 [Ruminococcaceae bacterium]|nr:hypothetical protein [Oscillospiraceae bacterium]
MKKNSLSREIAKSTLWVSLITLALSLITFIFVYFTKKDVPYALTATFCMGFVTLLLLSLTLPMNTAKKIADKINTLDVENMGVEDTYTELYPLKKKIKKYDKKVKENLEKMDLLHTEQDKMRRDFTANVSHELKTPLTSIKGYSELIRDGLVKEEDVPRFAGKIFDESHRLITLVGDIIKLSQLDGKDIEVKIEKINLWDLTLGVIEHLDMMAKEKDVTITLSGDKSFVFGGEQIIEEMIYNLLDNAIKYNKQGGEVKIKIRQRIDGVEFEIADTGIGISEEDLPHIFERFWRADKSHSKEIGGTGLGLSIVKHGAMFMSASVTAKSEVGVGTTIRILF